MQSGKGKEDTENLYATHLLKCELCDISSLQGGTAFMQAYWMYAFDTTMQHINLLPNCAGCMRTSWAGEVAVLLLEINSLVQHVHTVIGKPADQLAIKDVITIVEHVDTKALEQWRQAGVIMFYHVQGPKQILYMPQGWLIAEAIQKDSQTRLVCGGAEGCDQPVC